MFWWSRFGEGIYAPSSTGFVLVLVLAPTNANKMHGGEWEQAEGRRVQNYRSFFVKIICCWIFYLSKLSFFSFKIIGCGSFFIKIICCGSFFFIKIIGCGIFSSMDVGVLFFKIINCVFFLH